MLADWKIRLRAILRRGSVETEMDAELRYHLERQAEKHLGDGMTLGEAERRARIELGGLEKAREECRDARGTRLVESVAQDVGYGMRILRRSPGFTAVVLVTLALGIGATTTVFSVVNAILIKPLPYPNAERVMMPWRIAPPSMTTGFSEAPWGRADFLEFAQQTKTFSSIGAFQFDTFNLTGRGDPVQLDGARVSAGFFPALGTAPTLGRWFTREEDTRGEEHVVVLGDALWRERFGADAAMVGRGVALNGETYTVIGVMPQGFAFPRGAEMPRNFTFPRETQLWVPRMLPPGPYIPAEPYELAVMGRLAPGISAEQAQAELDVFARQYETHNPRFKGLFSSRVTPLEQQVTGEMRRPLLLILGAVGAILLIVCSNLATLLLGRALARSREFALRAVLGAGPGRMIRQLLTESLVMACGGGLLGMLVARAGIRLVRVYGPANIPRLNEVGLDWTLFLFALGVALTGGIVFGLAPAIGATGRTGAKSLKEGGTRTSGSQAALRMRQILLVTQTALALVLAATAGLLARTVSSLTRVDAGFDRERVLTFQITLPSAKYPNQTAQVTAYQRVLERLRATAGVESAGISLVVPMGGATEGTSIRLPDRTTSNDQSRPYASYSVISPGYLGAVRTPLLRGRDFLETDTADSPPVTIISRAMAQKYWPGENPIGKQVGPASLKYPVLTIVGIVPDVKRISMREEPAPEMYVNYTQKPWPSMLNMSVVVRTKSEPGQVTASAKEALHSVDPDLPMAQVATLAEIVDTAMSQQRFAMLLLAAFGGLAMVLAAVGVYGTISHWVEQRTRELGLRMALGAQRPEVLRMVLGQGARVAALGIGIGLAVALAVGRSIAGFLFGVKPGDALTFTAVSALLAVVALAACYIPARRAMRLDPMAALRQE